MEQSKVINQIQELEKKLSELKKVSDGAANSMSSSPQPVTPVEADNTPDTKPVSIVEVSSPLSFPPDRQDGEEENYIPIGETGVFDGEFTIMPNEKKYQVPPNYASKSRLVVGDKLQLVSHGDMNSFKIMEQVPRKELTGILTKSDNQWVVFVDEVNYLVIAASIRYYEGEIGDKVVIQVPENPVMEVKWAAVKSVLKEGLAVDPEKRRAERAIVEAKEAEESKPRVSMYGGEVIETPVPPNPRKPKHSVKPVVDSNIFQKKEEPAPAEIIIPKKVEFNQSATKRDVIVELKPKSLVQVSLPQTENGEVTPEEIGGVEAVVDSIKTAHGEVDNTGELPDKPLGELPDKPQGELPDKPQGELPDLR